MAVLAGWDATACTFLTSVWPIIIRADGPYAAQLATCEDETGSGGQLAWPKGSAWVPGVEGGQV